MTLLSTHEASRVRNLALSALHHIAADQLCEVADIVALITPSQPGDASRSHAPAADTPDLPAGVKVDGEVVPSASPSAEPIPEAPKPLPAASVVPDDARPAEAKTSAEDALSSASGGVQGGLPAHPAAPSPAVEPDTEQTAECAPVRPRTSKLGDGNGLRLKGNGTAKMDSAATTPSVGVRDDGALAAGGIAQREDDASPALSSGPPETAPRPSPSERFYIRDALGRYVHQGLEPSPVGTGPLMTANRVYAWFGNRKQFKGAAKRWPELNGMRRIRPQS